jgi:hypothetical protein
LLTDWKIPDSIEDAEERKRILVAEVQEIQAQFSNRNRKRESDLEAFFDWRYKAIWAMTTRLEELRLVKQWLKTQNSVCPHCEEAIYV